MTEWKKTQNKSIMVNGKAAFNKSLHLNKNAYWFPSFSNPRYIVGLSWFIAAMLAADELCLQNIDK
ncbi:MAG: hypothetical protein K8R79_08440 [Calditrichales bacterium]|nr:hypothetical protein [Calditrichales bacterium]